MNKKITLVVFEGNSQKHNETERVFNKMKSLFDWTHAIYVKKNFTWEQAQPFESCGNLLEFIHKDTTHILYCTWDGFITNPHLWKDDWLEYDMIGAPWPHRFVEEFGFKNRVGNSGFCLQSRKLLGLAYAYKDHYTQNYPSDAFLCHHMYDIFIQNGIKYAPLHIASKFSWELDIEESLNGSLKTSFGFHGWTNWKSKEEIYNTYLN